MKTPLATLPPTIPLIPAGLSLRQTLAMELAPARKNALQKMLHEARDKAFASYMESRSKEFARSTARHFVKYIESKIDIVGGEVGMWSVKEVNGEAVSYFRTEIY